jgi:hypothetical protein
MGQAPAQCLKWLTRLVALDKFVQKIPLSGGSKYGGKIDPAIADIRHASTRFLHIFHMREGKAAGILAKQRDRIAAAFDCPVNIHFEIYEFGIELLLE